MSRRSGHASGSLAKRPCGSFSPVAVTRYSPSGPLSGPLGLACELDAVDLDRDPRQRRLTARAGRERRSPVVGHLRPAEGAAHDRPGAAGKVIRDGERGVAAVGREPQQRLRELDLVGVLTNGAHPLDERARGDPATGVGGEGEQRRRLAGSGACARCDDALDRRPAPARGGRAGEPRGRDVQDAARVVVELAQRRGEGLELRRERLIAAAQERVHDPLVAHVPRLGDVAGDRLDELVE